MSLWRWSELCAAVGAPITDGPDIDGVAIDSRTLTGGELFIALPGDPGLRFHVGRRSERDGHDYVGAAFEAGAAGALVHRDVRDGNPCILVEETIDALWDLARAARERLSGRVIAVTGSSGKTTVKGFMAQALGAFSTPGSLNNHLGVPLSLARTPADTGFAVYEIGTSHPGEIAPLARLTSPDVAVVLNVHPAHIEYFADIGELTREKLSIADGLPAGGTLVCLDTLNPNPSALDPGMRVLTFGLGSHADVRLMSSTGGVAVVSTPAGTVETEIPGGGEHRALALAAVAAAIVALGEDPVCITRIGADAVPAGRGNHVRVGAITLIDDSYNANPASMAAALRSLATESGRTIAVLGEMLELGDDGERHHAGMAAACRGVDRVVCVGEAMRALYDRLPSHQRLASFDSPEDIDTDVIVDALQPGDVLLLKGSNRVFWAQDFAGALRRRIEERSDAEGTSGEGG